MRNRIFAATVLALALTAAAVPVGAQSAAPELTDPAGDANFIHNQGLPADPGSHDTRPASIEGADIRSISFDTTYTTTKTLREDGTVSFVLYTPTGLDITVAMEGPILPTAGPSMGVRVPVSIDGCETAFQTWWRGETAAVDGGFQWTEIRKSTASCPGGANTVLNGFGQTISGSKVTMHFPFDAAAFNCSTATGCAPGLVRNGAELGSAPTYLNSQNNPHSVTQQFVNSGVGASVHLYTTQIDQTARFGSYTIGSDVPANVDCTATPDHPECQSA